MSTELWGGVECSHVHLRDRTVDQLEITGHADRSRDIELIAALGLRAVRYPVLYDRVGVKGGSQGDWSWVDERLNSLRQHGVRPVVTLQHHGTRYLKSDLRDAGFATSLAAFAGTLSERHPWLRDFTPVNEPLTTARFGFLYGHWWPHLKDEGAFLQAVVSQVRATILSMKAVREINREARLVYTAELGHTHSTPALRYQADYENERRWLALDLLCGRVVTGHPFHGRLRSAGFSEREIEWFTENSCPPDVLGCNYYPTCERFLDMRLGLYPRWSHGGNLSDRYADVHADIAPDCRPLGLQRALLVAWERYGLPLALTEVHLNAPPGRQIRWLNQAWAISQRLVQQGVPVEAVCSWALFGCQDWDSLLTQEHGHFEPGAFTLRQGRPVATPLADAVRELSIRDRPERYRLRPRPAML